MPLHAVPRPAQGNFAPPKAAQSMSVSHVQYPNHAGTGDIQAQFEPTYVKLDKQVRYISILRRAAARLHISFHTSCLLNSAHLHSASSLAFLGRFGSYTLGRKATVAKFIGCLCATGEPAGTVLDRLEIGNTRAGMHVCAQTAPAELLISNLFIIDRS